MRKPLKKRRPVSLGGQQLKDAARVEFVICADFSAIEKSLGPQQIQAFMRGIAQVVAAANLNDAG